MAAKVRKTVLVLHGYSQNASIFSNRLGALRKDCAKSGVDFVFIDAPHILKPADIFPRQSSILDAENQNNQADTEETDPSSLARAWWTYDRERSKAVGLEESLVYIRDILRGRKFDGVLGFSQGAAFAAVIASLLERPDIHPPFLFDGKSPHSPLQFCVAISGFKLLDPMCQPFFEPAYTTPTLHVVGKTDVVVVEERSRMLIDVSSNKRVEEHEGGHYVPSKGNWRHFFADYMRDPFAPHPSPVMPTTLSGNSTPGSDAEPTLMMKL